MKRLGLFVGAILAAAAMAAGAIASPRIVEYTVPAPIREAARALCDSDTRAMWTTLDSELQSEFDYIAQAYNIEAPTGESAGEAAFVILNEGNSTCVSYQYVGQYTDEGGNAKVVYAYTYESKVVWYIFTGNAAEGNKVSAIE